MAWLISGIPALIIFWMIPAGTSAAQVAGSLLMIIELGFLKKSADKILLIKRETGILPTLRERLLLASTGIGLLFFAIFIDQKMDRITTLILGTVSVIALTVSKLLVLRSRITPVREAGQRA